jgi:hypothetical protein
MVPVWVLVGFATWTVLLLLATVGVYRWSRILTGRVPIRSLMERLVHTRDAGTRELRRKPSGFWRNMFCAVRWKRGQRLCRMRWQSRFWRRIRARRLRLKT